MYHQNLSGQWKFHQLGEKEWLPATVPGGVHTDLLALGKIPDPFVADNEKKVQWIGETDWEYRYEFKVAPEVLKDAKQFLVCDGLDTLAEVSLNGKLLGKTDNMYRQWNWDVTGALKKDVNELVIIFRAPVTYITTKQKDKPLPGGGRHPRRASPAQSPLPMGLGLGSQAAAHRRVEGYLYRGIFHGETG